MISGGGGFSLVLCPQKRKESNPWVVNLIVGVYTMLQLSSHLQAMAHLLLGLLVGPIGLGKSQEHLRWITLSLL